MSDRTAKFLDECCTKDLQYSSRSQLRNEFGGLPRIPSSKTPKLDGFIKSELSSSCKTLDKELVRTQHHMLDALGPLSAIIEAEVQKRPLSHNDVLKAVKSACQLIGNASCKISNLRREKVVKDFNKSLLPMLEESSFSAAVPNLFGSGFAKQSKEYVEQVKAMRSSLSRPSTRSQGGGSGSSNHQPFRNGPPAKRRGFNRQYGNHWRGNRSQFKHQRDQQNRTKT